ncbi:dNA mismatch repair protein MutL [Clostridium sp. CAG:710]|nr:dNA mismatch repair protein MutL [Clostridium sp. CAG:710]
MSKIQVMSMDLSNKIAAGEVIEKTMNVVKELVENSIDAGATTIKIDLLDSGVGEIIVTDDGVGMDREDATLAFSRHATSKLKSLNDLFNIESLGFRGEALPSIAAVSNVTLKTSNGEVGTEVNIVGGKINYVKSADLAKGTKFIVRDLFYNTPVRLKYLKNLYVELANITEYVNKMALSYPNIKFVLTNNNKQLLNTEGHGNLLKVINNIYGVEVAKKMVKIDASNDDYVIKGYICYPEISKPNRSSIITFVNGRYIRNNELNRTITEAYHTYLMIDKFPIVVINIEVDPILVDINIHPTKMDIKFSKMDTLKSLITDVISKTLRELTLIPKAKHEEIKPSPITSYSVSEEPSVYNDNYKDYDKVEEVRLDFDSTLNNNEETFEEIEEPNKPAERLKKMYPVGLVHGTYIICENEDGMYIIDQHAAAERINYEKYFTEMKKVKHDTTALLVPIKIELPTDEAIRLKHNIGVLLDMGFEIEEFGINTFIVRVHPTWLPTYMAEEAIRKIINIVIEKESFDYGKFIEHVAITLACKMSIKANDFITMEDIEILLENLRNTKNPFTCPHGRPTIISYSKYDLEKLFKRAVN